MTSRLHADDPRTERIALWVGLTLASTSLTVMGLLALTQPDVARALGLQWVAHTALGKETSVPAGLALGLPPPLVALAAFAQDAVVLLVGYPMVLRMGRGALRWRWLHRLVVEKPHPRHQAFATRTEAPGVAVLALTMWIPFMPSGALVAALLARTAGYRPRIFLPVMTMSALAASIAYVEVYQRLANLLSPKALWALVGLGALASVVATVAAKLRARRANAAAASVADEAPPAR